jgi:hypothetical protein
MVVGEVDYTVQDLVRHYQLGSKKVVIVEILLNHLRVSPFDELLLKSAFSVGHFVWLDLVLWFCAG